MSNQTTPLSRRTFMKATAGACVMSAAGKALAAPPNAAPFRLGVVVWISDGESIDEAVRSVRDFGLHTCQIGFEHLTPEVAEPVKAALAKYAVEATAFSEHGPGERIFNFYQGPGTIGIVPSANREARIRNLQLAADIATKCGIPAIHTHCGFIPEEPNNPLYAETVGAMKRIAGYCKERGRLFLCETGEETPITLLRMIEDIGLGNVFVNLDVANIIMCGKGNPVDAMDVFGHLVRGVHAKDGLFPTDTRSFGKEVALGQGRVDFPAVLKRLRQVNYQGPILIEQESDGPEHKAEILRCKTFLQDLIAKA